MTNEVDSTSSLRQEQMGNFSGKFINIHKHSGAQFTITNMSNKNKYRHDKILYDISTEKTKLSFRFARI